MASSLTRRRLLEGGIAVASASVGASLMLIGSRARNLQQVVMEPGITQFEFVTGAMTRNVMSYAAGQPCPVLRVKQDEPLSVLLRNGLKEPTTIHWHGIRLPNAMDGVPFMTQSYVCAEQTFEYAFSPPDAGTYWYHPHCNSLEQMSYGLTGVLIVDEKKDPGFDADIALNLRDWRIGADGQFINLFVARQTARAGTYGTVRTANWRREPEYDAATGALVRLRLVVTDVTRVYKLAVEGASALIIALDGNPMPEPVPLTNFAVGPGQRMDLAIRMPEIEGEKVTLVDYSSPTPVVLTRLRAVGTSKRRDLRDVKALPSNPFPVVDFKDAPVIPLDFMATPEQVPRKSFCGDIGYSFWAINRVSWPGLSPDPLAPLVEMKLGKAYVLSIVNRTPHPHPVHLHGMSFKLLRSDRRQLPPVWTDTVLVTADERVEVGLVADNPGDWLLHCHIIEHQESGMSGYIRVT